MTPEIMGVKIQLSRLVSVEGAPTDNLQSQSTNEKDELHIGWTSKILQICEKSIDIDLQVENLYDRQKASKHSNKEGKEEET